MLLQQIGIHGWDNIEPVILSAIVADLSILLIGDHGANKTEGSRTIAQAVLGSQINFRSYEVPTMSFDDLVGFVNPKRLTNGKLDFVDTPLSIWNAQAVLFDEINRANPFIQSKLHEIVRSRSLMGLPTDLEIVFSAVNPPERYMSGYMDLALASRFVCVAVPGISQMNDDQIDHILSGNGVSATKPNLKRIVKKAATLPVTPTVQERIHTLCKKVVHELKDQPLIFNARQIKMMSRLIQAALALEKVTDLPAFTRTDAVVACITSVIPEINQVVKSRADNAMVTSCVRNVVSGVVLEDPILMASNVSQLCDVQITDVLAWAQTVNAMIATEDNPNVLHTAMDKVRTLTRDQVIDMDISHNLLCGLATRIVIQQLGHTTTGIPELKDRVEDILATL